LLRAVLRDDGSQSFLAQRLTDEAATKGTPVLINLIVLVEALWTLRRVCRFDRAQILDLARELLNTSTITLERHALVASAVASCGATRADLPDALIGLVNREAGCAATYSFDAGVLALPHFAAVPSHS
jgi:predicted nucleic-acid-binding protein